MTLRFEEIIRKLSAAGIEAPRLEARLLMQNAPDEKTLEEMLTARLNHKPLDKILGRKEFYKYTFKVNTDVLSPRPDTEILVESALEILHQNKIDSVLELGVGSGCVLLSVLADVARLQGIGIDKSPKALEVAAENAALLGVNSRCHLKKADWFEPSFLEKLGKTFDMVVSNPPYIAHAEIETLAPEVKNYDPHLALDGGQDGLESYRKIADLAPSLLNDGGFLLLEAGINQAKDICALMCANGLLHLQTQKDLAGIDRVIIFQKKGCNL